jgi:hypothetical protein
MASGDENLGPFFSLLQIQTVFLSICRNVILKLGRLQLYSEFVNVSNFWQDEQKMCSSNKCKNYS